MATTRTSRSHRLGHPEWKKNGQPWTPDPAKSLAENGLVTQGRDPLQNAQALTGDQFARPPADRSMSYQLTIEPLGATIEVEDGQTVLDAALRQGIYLPHACGHGLCGTCKVQVARARWTTVRPTRSR
jgi:ferredoxin